MLTGCGNSAGGNTTDFGLLQNGDGTTAFDGAELVYDNVKVDNEALRDYFVEELHGEIGTEYADPYGRGSIVIK